MDEFLKKFVDKYDEWRKSEQFTYSSKIIPVGISFEAKQWVLPQEQVLKVLQDARSFALTDCICRTHYTRCDKPREVCLLIDEMSDKAVERAKARRITLAEASEVLKKADEHGLVHMTLYMPAGRSMHSAAAVPAAAMISSCSWITTAGTLWLDPIMLRSRTGNTAPVAGDALSGVCSEQDHCVTVSWSLMPVPASAAGCACPSARRKQP